MFIRMALSSLWSRKGSVLLTFLAITVSVFVLLGVETIRHQAKSSFNNTVSGIDLIVGARTGDVNLLLYSVFRLGNATNNVSWQSYQTIANDPKVAWTIPLSLGDSHKGYRVMGTTEDYFHYFRYGGDRSLVLAQGQAFADTFDIVLGSAVARSLGYQLGDKLVLAHGLGSTSFSKHDDSPFKVVGILQPTGTPVDQTLHVSLAGIEAIHSGWPSGSPRGGSRSPAAHAADPHSSHRHDHDHDAPYDHNEASQAPTPEAITAFMVGLESKMATFQMQRQINTYSGEPLLAILPGVTISQLWQMMAVMERTLQLIAALVLLASLLGLAAMLLATIRERRPEIAVMRAIGASPVFVFALLEVEATIITLGSCLLAALLLTVGASLSANWLAAQFSLMVDPALLLNTGSAAILGMVLAATVAITLVPGIQAYRYALKEQL